MGDGVCVRCTDVCLVCFLWGLDVFDVGGGGDDVCVDECLCGVFVDAFVVLGCVWFDWFVVEGVCWVAFSVLCIGVVDFAFVVDVELGDCVVGVCGWLWGFE